MLPHYLGTQCTFSVAAINYFCDSGGLFNVMTYLSNFTVLLLFFLPRCIEYKAV